MKAVEGRKYSWNCKANKLIEFNNKCDWVFGVLLGLSQTTKSSPCDYNYEPALCPFDNGCGDEHLMYV